MVDGEGLRSCREHRGRESSIPTSIAGNGRRSNRTGRSRNVSGWSPTRHSRFLIWLAAYLAIRQSLSLHHLGLFLVGLILFVVPLPLGQYHCLDCGATGWAVRAARHACPSVVARLHHPDAGWLRVPRLRTQFKAWIVLVLLALLTFAILASPRH